MNDLEMVTTTYTGTCDVLPDNARKLLDDAVNIIWISQAKDDGGRIGFTVADNTKTTYLYKPDTGLTLRFKNPRLVHVFDTAELNAGVHEGKKEIKGYNIKQVYGIMIKAYNNECSLYITENEHSAQFLDSLPDEILNNSMNILKLSMENTAVEIIK